jgi:tetratricopeptide (TPR) repeat protein
VLEKRKKISKKEIKQDTLVTSYYKAYSFFIENQVKILIGVGVVALVVVAIVLYSNKKSGDTKTASVLLAKVMPTYDGGQYKQAIEGIKASNVVGLKEIVDGYGSTEPGEAAKIMLASSYFYTGDYENALENYEDYSGSNALFKATALAGEAAYYEVKNDLGKAAGLYKDAAQVDKVNPSNSDYLLRASINYLKVGKKEEAKSLLKMIKKDFRTTSAAQEVDKYLIQVEG